MAKIYSAPKEIKEPNLDFANIPAWREDEKRYENEVRDFCKKHGSGQLAGEIIKIPTADSYAFYMVFKLKPVTLIHLRLGDAWYNDLAECLTATKIKQMVEADKRLAELFAKKS